LCLESVVDPADERLSWGPLPTLNLVKFGQIRMTTTEPNYDSLLRSNLERVFNERDATKRELAVRELFVDEPVMYEPTNILLGGAAISEVAGKLLEQFGPDFRFIPEGVAVGHHGFACLRWHAGPNGGAITVTGMDAAEIVEGKIARLWVVIDPPATSNSATQSGGIGT